MWQTYNQKNGALDSSWHALVFLSVAMLNLYHLVNVQSVMVMLLKEAQVVRELFMDAAIIPPVIFSQGKPHLREVALTVESSSLSAKSKAGGRNSFALIKAAISK
jgi:hypothetical protein